MSTRGEKVNGHNILTYVEELVTNGYFHYPWEIKWEEVSNQLQLTFYLSFDNSQRYEIEDKYGVTATCETVYYPITILFVENTTEVIIKGKEVIKVIEVDAVKGIAMGELRAIVMYLKQLTTMSRSLFFDFLYESDPEVFEIMWNESHFQQTKQRLIDSNRFALDAIYFPILK